MIDMFLFMYRIYPNQCVKCNKCDNWNFLDCLKVEDCKCKNFEELEYNE